MNDSDKLRLLADWLDVFDLTVPAIVQALRIAQRPDLANQWAHHAGDDEIQRDLRRIADRLEVFGEVVT
ncbi:MAG: hypothetical protein DWQ40_00305 [Actinobacteria bacterium]|nr:MAG: hypothetical protein DWQ40_00305 [Actinomycetota bacterium]REK35588.1 MAG: hypothetical protein DWQ20_06080 [Actinomycetota bacterium]